MLAIVKRQSDNYKVALSSSSEISVKNRTETEAFSPRYLPRLEYRVDKKI